MQKCRACISPDTYLKAQNEYRAGLDTVDVQRMFPLVRESRTRGHHLRITGHTFRKVKRRNFLSQRVLKLWDSICGIGRIRVVHVNSRT